MNATLEGTVLEREEARTENRPADAPLAASGGQLMPRQANATSLLVAITEAASNPSMDIDKMERLFAMHQKVVEQEREAAFNDAMARAQRSMVPVVKNRRNDQTSSMYADLGAICSMLTPLHTAEGISLSFDSERPVLDVKGDPIPPPPAGWFRTVALVSHAAGHSRVHYIDLPTDDVGLRGNANKTPIQGVVSMMSYGRRCLTCMVFNVAMGDDGDGNAPKNNADKIREHKEQRQQEQSPATGKPAYPNEKLTPEIFKAWRELVTAGTKTADQIIATIQAKYTLSEQQIDRIRTATKGEQ